LKHFLAMSNPEAFLFTKCASKTPKKYTGSLLLLHLPTSGFSGWAKKHKPSRIIAHADTVLTAVIGVVSVSVSSFCTNGREQTSNGLKSASYWILELSKNFRSRERTKCVRYRNISNQSTTQKVK
jgi:hypothetical protein